MNITLLGATGSIGTSTLDVIRQHPERFQVTALCAQKNVEAMVRLCEEFQPSFAVMADLDAAAQLQSLLPRVEVLAGVEGLIAVSALPEVDTVLAAIVGAAGLEPTLAAAKAGKRILLANKEALVMAGALLMDVVRASGATLLPVDSEHNAIFQSMPDGYRCGDNAQAHIGKIILTASGGPFRDYPLADFASITPAQAVAHPNWSMGPKISVDSATMMNKGLELIEAHWLFALTADKIEVVIHPQSIVHSMVQYHDGSVLAQMGNPDMRTPIAHTLAWPERITSGVSPLDLVSIGQLSFQAVDFTRFECLQLAYQALSAGGAMPAVLNAANEVAVAQFLAGKLRFIDIPRLIAGAMDAVSGAAVERIDDLLALDAEVRSVGLALSKAI